MGGPAWGRRISHSLMLPHCPWTGFARSTTRNARIATFVCFDGHVVIISLAPIMSPATCPSQCGFEWMRCPRSPPSALVVLLAPCGPRWSNDRTQACTTYVRHACVQVPCQPRGIGALIDRGCHQQVLLGRMLAPCANHVHQTTHTLPTRWLRAWSPACSDNIAAGPEAPSRAIIRPA